MTEGEGGDEGIKWLLFPCRHVFFIPLTFCFHFTFSDLFDICEAKFLLSAALQPPGPGLPRFVTCHFVAPSPTEPVPAPPPQHSPLTGRRGPRTSDLIVFLAARVFAAQN